MRTSRLDAAAAQWFARLDRGLSPSEQAELETWLKDARHAAAFEEAGATWSALAPLQAMRGIAASAGSPPDPDLLVRNRARPRFRLLIGLSAAAACFLVVFLMWRTVPSGVRPGRHYAAAEAVSRFVLPDGSMADLNGGSEISVADETAERRVDLVRGEAHFTVVTGARPFVVHAGAVAVRDLGTAFDVRIAGEQVNVLVTQGRVAVSLQGRAADHGSVLVAAGQGALVQGGTIEVREAGLAETGRLLAWKGHHLIFADTPLAEAAAQMNLYNLRKLVIGDAETGSVRVGGNFQADNLDGFVRLMEEGFGITAEVRGENEIVLHKSR